MPRARPCLDCGRLSQNGTRCSRCERKRNRRKNARSPYQSRQWRQIRKARRAAGATICAVCGSDRYVAQHHGENVAGGGDLDGPTIPLCASCHGAYEGDVRAGRRTKLVDLVDRLLGR